MMNHINEEVILAARLLLATLFLIFGWRKLRDYSGTVSQMVQEGVPMPTLATAVSRPGGSLQRESFWRDQFPRRSHEPSTKSYRPSRRSRIGTDAIERCTKRTQPADNDGVLDGFVCRLSTGWESASRKSRLSD